jgi:hypothetical protein
MASTGDRDIVTDSGTVTIDVITSKKIAGGTQGILKRHPEEKENVSEYHFPKLKFERND